jgi:o-succinylbenzoate---CoA ligase
MIELASSASYFDPSTVRVDWEGKKTLMTVNPEWFTRNPDDIQAGRNALPALAAHIWVATSGSSRVTPGHIRWVALAKTAFLASARAVNQHLESTSQDVWAHALPVFHVGGLGILARAALSGARVEPAVAARWDAGRYAERLHAVKATLTALVPAQIHDLVNQVLRAPTSLRAVVVGGGRLDPELCADARRLGWPCLPSYGLTETCSQIATASLASARTTRCSGPLPVLSHAEIREDADQRLQVRAASLLTCYAEMTDDGMRAWDPKQDGWLATDDLGRTTGDGVEVLGRSTESVKVLGETVSLLRVEDVARRWLSTLGGAPGVSLDLAVVALPHPRLGHEIVVALAGPARRALESRTDAELLPSLQDFARDALLPYEQPRRISWRDLIPRTALGKCQRQLLAREMALEAGTDR